MPLLATVLLPEAAFRPLGAVHGSLSARSSPSGQSLVWHIAPQEMSSGIVVSIKYASICSQQAALARKDLPCTYLAHHELESVEIIVIVIVVHPSSCAKVCVELWQMHYCNSLQVTTSRSALHWTHDISICTDMHKRACLCCCTVAYLCKCYVWNLCCQKLLPCHA